MNERLALKIAATNKANAYANFIYPALAELFTPYVGQKILKADGELLAKIAQKLPTFERRTGLHTWRNTRSPYSLVWGIQASESWGDNGSTIYAEATVYVGSLSDGVLTQITPPAAHRTDYTLADIQAKREALEAAEKAMRDAQAALHPFSDRD